MCFKNEHLKMKLSSHAHTQNYQTLIMLIFKSVEARVSQWNCLHFFSLSTHFSSEILMKLSIDLYNKCAHDVVPLREMPTYEACKVPERGHETRN